MASVMKPQVTQQVAERHTVEHPVMFVSDRAYDDILQACEGDEEPTEALVRAYALYRQRVISER